MKVLFVCSGNRHRSATAHKLFEELYPWYEIDSAGTNHKVCENFGTNPLTEDLLEWADKVFVMEEHHIKIIKEHTGKKYTNKIKVLGIKDVYEYGDTDLEILLEKKVGKL